LDYSSWRENIIRAVDTMATSPGPLNERLADAFSPFLVSLHPNEIPPELREQFMRVTTRATKASPNAKQGQLRAALNAMTPDELRELAQEIWDMFTETTDPYGNNRD
jgi:hypothetical protein